MLRSILSVIMGGAFLLNGMAYAGSETFTNGMEISTQQNNGEATAAMPDTCISPPSPPAGPVPVPYPNTSSASDTQKGSKKVKIGGKQIMLKGAQFEKSAGDEDGTTDKSTSQNTQTERYRHIGPKILKEWRRP